LSAEKRGNKRLDLDTRKLAEPLINETHERGVNFRKHQRSQRKCYPDGARCNNLAKIGTVSAKSLPKLNPQPVKELRQFRAWPSEAPAAYGPSPDNARNRLKSALINRLRHSDGASAA